MMRPTRRLMLLAIARPILSAGLPVPLTCLDLQQTWRHQTRIAALPRQADATR